LSRSPPLMFRSRITSTVTSLPAGSVCWSALTTDSLFGLCVLVGPYALSRHPVGLPSRTRFLHPEYQERAGSRVEANAEAPLQTCRWHAFVPVGFPRRMTARTVHRTFRRRALYRHASSYSIMSRPPAIPCARSPGSRCRQRRRGQIRIHVCGDYVVQPNDLPLVSIYQWRQRRLDRFVRRHASSRNRTEDPEPPVQPKTKNKRKVKLALVPVNVW